MSLFEKGSTGTTTFNLKEYFSNDFSIFNIFPCVSCPVYVPYVSELMLDRCHYLSLMVPMVSHYRAGLSVRECVNVV